MYTFNSAIVSDLHKDAYGFRPGQDFWVNWTAASHDRKQEIWDDLIDTMRRSMDAEAEREREIVKEYESTIADFIRIMSCDRDRAVQYYLDALDLSESEKFYDSEYLCFKLGLPYSYAPEFAQASTELIRGDVA